MARQQMARQQKASQHLAKTSVIAAVLAGVMATSALAQSVPLPTPRPTAHHARADITGTVVARNNTPTIVRPPANIQYQAQNDTPSLIPNPFANLLGKPGTPITLTPEQRAIAERVDNYLSSVQQLQGQFVQVGPDGSRSKGEFYIAKPGRVRFEYDPPSTIELIADGSSVVVRDTKLATQDVYPLSQTPLRFLLADHVNLMKDAGLVAVYADDVFVTAVVEEKNGMVGTSRLMIMFSAKDMQLKQWTVTDPQGYDTTVAVYNLDSSKQPNPAMFKIDYNRYRN
ncbi:MAG: outer membrane lipoprotein carrier protein LolA [Rhodopseudomonas sp.]|nr:outer membrane lipoprotein carrier protein LolA [Rhodopseudomonas sp.]